MRRADAAYTLARWQHFSAWNNAMAAIAVIFKSCNPAKISFRSDLNWRSPRLSWSGRPNKDKKNNKNSNAWQSPAWWPPGRWIARNAGPTFSSCGPKYTCNAAFLLTTSCCNRKISAKLRNREIEIYVWPAHPVNWNQTFLMVLTLCEIVVRIWPSKLEMYTPAKLPAITAVTRMWLKPELCLVGLPPCTRRIDTPLRKCMRTVRTFSAQQQVPVCTYSIRAGNGILRSVSTCKA